MKIVAGNYKYRNIEVPRGVRPTTEKVREAIFSMIRDWIPDAIVLDLFAGSGALGLEALSRGAKKCYFNEGNRTNFKTLSANIDNCKANKDAILINKDYKSAILNISDTLDVVFIDPPYNEITYYETAMMMLQDNSLIEKGSIVVAEHLYDNELLETYGKFMKIKEKKYGTIGVDIFELQE